MVNIVEFSTKIQEYKDKEPFSICVGTKIIYHFNLACLCAGHKNVFSAVGKVPVNREWLTIACTTSDMEFNFLKKVVDR